jgi:hypothetical protein
LRVPLNTATQLPIVGKAGSCEFAPIQTPAKKHAMILCGSSRRRLNRNSFVAEMFDTGQSRQFWHVRPLAQPGRFADGTAAPSSRRRLASFFNAEIELNSPTN